MIYRWNRIPLSLMKPPANPSSSLVLSTPNRVCSPAYSPVNLRSGLSVRPPIARYCLTCLVIARCTLYSNLSRSRSSLSREEDSTGVLEKRVFNIFTSLSSSLPPSLPLSLFHSHVHTRLLPLVAPSPSSSSRLASWVSETKSWLKKGRRGCKPLGRELHPADNASWTDKATVQALILRTTLRPHTPFSHTLS